MYTALDRKMAVIYAGRIDNEAISLDDVPGKIKPLVEELINS